MNLRLRGKKGPKSTMRRAKALLRSLFVNRREMRRIRERAGKGTHSRKLHLGEHTPGPELRATDAGRPRADSRFAQK